MWGFIRFLLRLLGIGRVAVPTRPFDQTNVNELIRERESSPGRREEAISEIGKDLASFIEKNFRLEPWQKSHIASIPHEDLQILGTQLAWLARNDFSLEITDWRFVEHRSPGICEGKVKGKRRRGGEWRGEVEASYKWSNGNRVHMSGSHDPNTGESTVEGGFQLNF